MPIHLTRGPSEPMSVTTPDDLMDLITDAVLSAQTIEPNITGLSDFLLDPVDPQFEHLYERSEFGVFLYYTFENILLDVDFTGNITHYLAKQLGIQPLYTLSGITHYYAFLAGEDDGIPMYHILYQGEDGKLHGYTPANGNAVNPFSSQPFSGKDVDDRIAQKVGFATFEDLASQLHDPAVAALVYDHTRMMQDALRDLSV